MGVAQGDIPVLDEVIFSLLDLVKDSDASVQVKKNVRLGPIQCMHARSLSTRPSMWWRMRIFCLSSDLSFLSLRRAIHPFSLSLSIIQVRRTSANHQLGLLTLLCQVLDSVNPPSSATGNIYLSTIHPSLHQNHHPMMKIHLLPFQLMAISLRASAISW